MARRSYDLADRLLDFAVSVGQITKAFSHDRLGSRVASQLIRSGTAPAAECDELIAIFVKSIETAQHNRRR